MQPNDVLFRPFRSGQLVLANRIVMAPMTRKFAPNGIPGEANAAYYRRRAEGGVGLILTEGTTVDRPASRNDPGIPHFHGDTALAGWSGVVDAVHDAGSKIGPQLWHVGAMAGQSPWEPPAPPESPSGLVAAETARGQAMTEEAIADTVAAFAKSAAHAKALGFDIVELHGAHGYLIDQFFWGTTNRRDDRYGGATIRERARFAAEVVASVRQAVGPDFPLSLRVSQWKQQDYGARLAETPHAMAEWLQPLVAAGVTLLHCSQRRFWEAEFPEIDGQDGLNFAGWAKKLTGAPTISVGSVGLSGEVMAGLAGETSTNTGLGKLVARMERDEFDLVAVGRALLGEPGWAAKVRDGRTHDMTGFDRSILGALV